MFTVYVLQSENGESRYIGVTAQAVEKRITEHDYGSTRSTKGKGPFKLIYYEKIRSRSAALSREKFFKTGEGRRFLAKFVG
jgi:putative endonuclease